MAEASDTRRCPQPEPNIVFNPLPQLSWEKTKAAESAQKLADYVSCEAQIAIAWYLDKKGSKKKWAQSLRFIAIIATALAGLIPLLSEMVHWLPAIMGSVALVVAATAVALDRFFGFSSGWMRFLTTEMEIRQALHRFLLDWEATQAKLAGALPDEAATQTLIQRCRDFIEEVNQILREEMDEWVKEFRQNLAEIDKAAKAEAQYAALGAVNVIVTNGEACEDGWEVSLDDRAPTQRQGKSAAFRGLTPGPHVVRISGSIQDKPVHAESAFIVARGRSEEVSLTLG